MDRLKGEKRKNFARLNTTGGDTRFQRRDNDVVRLALIDLTRLLSPIRRCIEMYTKQLTECLSLSYKSRTVTRVTLESNDKSSSRSGKKTSSDGRYFIILYRIIQCTI